MGEALLLVMVIAGVICLTVCVCFVAFLMVRRSTELEKERQKNERIITVEELKNERTRLSNEKSAIYANRDMITAQLEAGVLGGNDKEDDGGINSLLTQVLPLIMQNPELMNKIRGFFGNDTTSSASVGGEAGVNPVSFPQ